MPRLVASIDAGALGSLFTQHSTNVTVDGTGAAFASGATDVAWALYAFGGLSGETISGGSYTVSGLDSGEKVYVAISDYSRQRWLYLPLQNGTNVSFTLPDSSAGTYQSPLGNTTLLLAAYSGDAFKLEHLSLTYADRHTITGTVIDKSGAPVSGAVIRTPVGSISTTTDAAGNFSLAGLPNGTWPVLATLDGWTFYPQPQFVTVSGADAVAGDILGDPHSAHFDATDAMPGNDSLQTCPMWDFAANGALAEGISADSDFLDIYRFSVPAVGHWLLRFRNPDRNIFTPVFAVTTPAVLGTRYAEDIYAGEVGINFDVSDTSLPLLFLVAAAGGGGHYEVTLTQTTTGRLGLGMQSGADKRFNGMFQVVRQDSGLQTDYYSRSAINGGTDLAVFDRSYPVGNVHVTPVLSNHTFAPATADLNVQANGSVSSQLFGFTAPAVADNYEPNDSAGTAYVVPALPYNSPVPLQLTADYGGDYSDVFKFTPPAGMGVRVNVLYAPMPGEFSSQSRLSLGIENSIVQSVANVYRTPNGLAADLTELTDGNPYYVLLNAFPSVPADKETINYALQISTFPAHRFQVGARVGGVTPVDGMKFVVYDETFGIRISSSNQTADFLTTPRYVPDGSQFRVDCYRQGTPFDGLTKLVTVNADTTLNFDAPSLGADSHEPNGTRLTASALGFLPATVAATYFAFDDSEDFYSFGPGDGRPFKIELLSGLAPGQALTVYQYDSTGADVGSQRLTGPTASLYMPNDGNPGQSIEISTGNDYSFAYTLKVSNASAYRISGVVKDAAITGIDAVVCNRTTGSYAFASAAAGGAYSFTELVGSGSYDLACYALGYGPAVKEQTVSVSNMDVTADFLNFNAAVDDNYEPNDTPATAHMIALNTDYSASAFSMTTSDDDYYSIPLALGDRVRITVTPLHEWEQADVTLLDQYAVGYQEDYSARPAGTGTRQIDYTADASVNYTVRVSGGIGGGKGAGRYTLRVQKLN
jgi:hypothetical protein